MYLTREEEKMYEGEFGEAVRISMEILVTLGDIYDADRLINISSAQVSGASYKTIGDAGLEYLEDMVKNSATTSVYTTLNPIGMDLKRWEELNIPSNFAKKQIKIVKAYQKMGVTLSCTCTPYFCGNIPTFKSHIAWSESSAVIYANSVLGARTNREGGPSALAAAICGKTPRYGYHLEENRNPNVLVEVKEKLNGIDYAVLGYLIGKEINDKIPYFKMLNRPDVDDLKNLGAALASAGAVALYHIEGVTPEYSLIDKNEFEDKITVTKKDLKAAKEELSTTNEKPEIVCIGCPHSSIQDIKKVAEIVANKKLNCDLWVCTSLSTKIMADRMGYTKIIEKSGGKILCDTCMVVTPIEDLGYKTIGVDSAKAAIYLPSNNLDVIFNDLNNLI
ncbi:predicted aconitase subunit 1 [Methanothermus fervidus DSM 2088]|uniref:Phosphomevalonate dehydratase large subunit n=1 Tax=Methanothermus fervidus (strain ATCC 43054 / DSM 2088 / JCM 10308 / V24 S) TaxID=523846 RepID=E3GZH1_METFV|nr:aconitase X catalytic domain-containing protein [Methanothermus fervidus]ADP77703.1 predicted aconitase subunit 1 [Methanothermus fervidus DSM 2088]